jgi:hypothetical protein
VEFSEVGELGEVGEAGVGDVLAFVEVDLL